MADIPTVPEIDKHGGDDLPTYDDLAAQNGPNSRYALLIPLGIRALQLTHFVISALDAGENG